MAEFRKFRKFIDKIERDKEVRKSKEEKIQFVIKKSSLNRFLYMIADCNFTGKTSSRVFLEEYFKDPEKNKMDKMCCIVMMFISKFIRFTRERR